MAKGYKTGGRRKGSRNKAPDYVQRRLAALGHDPVAAVAALAEDTAAPLEYQLRAIELLLTHSHAGKAEFRAHSAAAFPQVWRGPQHRVRKIDPDRGIRR